MSIHRDLGNGGRNIIPSARRSIHSNNQSPLASGNDMVRFGDESSSDEDQPGQADAGVDEVDNILSKLPHSSSPLRMLRRNSLTPPNLLYTDDSDQHDALAKSLPATLPSRSNYSYDFDNHRESLANRFNKSDSATPRARGNRSKDSNRNLSFTRSPNVSHRINQLNHSHREQEKQSSGGTFIYFLGLLIAFGAAYCFYLINHALGSPQAKYDEVKFHSDLNELGAKYKVGDDSILQLQAGISTIFKREDTSCVIFLYNSLRNDFDSNKFDEFVNNVASNAAKFLRNDTTSVQHIVVSGAELNMGSHTQLVKAYREDVAKTGVLLIRGVERVPSPLAMAFHYYCDEYNPLVKKSAIFFTMNTAKCHNTGVKSSHASVESCLKEKWNTVPKDNIGPLLTRVASIVVDITSGI